MVSPTIIDSKDFEDKHGLLGKAVLIQNTKKHIFKVSDKTKYVLANINICNTNQQDAIVTIWLTSNYEPTLIDLYEHNLILKPDANYVRTNVVLSSGESIIVESNISNVVIRVDGYDDRSR